MKKKNSNREENHYYIQWGIATLVLIIYVVGTLATYSSRMKTLAEERAVDRIVRQAIELRGYYEGKTASMKELTVFLAGHVSKIEDEEHTLSILNSVVEGNEYEKAFIINRDGSAIDNFGNEYASVDTSEQYKEMLEGKTSLCVIKDVSGEASILVASPLVRERENIGYVALQYRPNDMEEFIGDPVYSYGLVFENGQVSELIGNDFICEKGENLIDKTKTMSFKNGSYSILSQGINGGRSVTALVTNEHGQSYYIVAQPVNGMESEIVVVARDTQVLRNAIGENQYTRVMILKLVISLIVFIILIVVIYILNRVAFSKTSKELQSKAETDLLTGLLNKVSTETKIKEYMAEDGKSKTSMMCVLDIDNFKKINDTMGHAFGDEVLASLGKQIGSEFRVTDIIGRTGGDEFIIFLKDLKDDEIILREASRVATFFKNFTVGDYTKYSATASIGAAVFPRDGSDFESLYKAADSALYKAKNRGKNQLAFYKDP